MNKGLLLFLILLAVSCQPKVSEKGNPINKTPKDGNVLESSKRFEEWLRTSHEEDLRKIADTNRVVFRLNWSRAFHPEVILRVENFPIYTKITDSLYHVEQYAISKVYLDELNDYSSSALPFLYEQRNTKISLEEVESLKALANQLKIWEVKSDIKEILDGSVWELEIYMNGKYHQVSSNSVNPAIKRIGQEMMALAKLKLPKDEIY
ncbi:hypothetical protein I5M27_17525 [Adhaeribacter sp. BT258]|uniref:Lipoprotein n=1 Tax=Adhaeribacter terrigena TaxID=2793070 RepID=A0ABS1C6F6_9BACT|nr:hypothetical protein [Adhaeribacter terrigena]MBK0404796.1 hypothetical protein [Adhaeribacter terrigena]